MFIVFPFTAKELVWFWADNIAEIEPHTSVVIWVFPIPRTSLNACVFSVPLQPRAEYPIPVPLHDKLSRVTPLITSILARITPDPLSKKLNSIVACIPAGVIEGVTVGVGVVVPDVGVGVGVLVGVGVGKGQELQADGLYNTDGVDVLVQLLTFVPSET